MDILNIGQEYDVVSTVNEIEDKEVIEYGILMKWEDEKGTESLQINSISQDEKEVIMLVERLRENDVDPMTLQEIVADFVAEINTELCFLVN